MTIDPDRIATELVLGIKINGKTLPDNQAANLAKMLSDAIHGRVMELILERDRYKAISEEKWRIRDEISDELGITPGDPVEKSLKTALKVIRAHRRVYLAAERYFTRGDGSKIELIESVEHCAKVCGELTTRKVREDMRDMKGKTRKKKGARR